MATTSRTHDSHRSSGIVDVRGLADHLHITESFVRRLVRERRIPYFKVGWLLRFDLGEVNEWLDRTRIDPFST